MIFCSGAVSHLDTWDYKPELIKRDGQPMPGGKARHVPGRKRQPCQAALALQAARPVRQDDLGPAAEPRGAGRRDVLHPFDDGEEQHARAGREPDEHRLHARRFSQRRRVGQLCSGQRCADLPAFVAIPDPRGVPQVGPNNWGSAFLPAVFQGTAFNADKPIANLRRPPEISAEAETATRDFLKALNEKHLAQHPGDTELSARIASYELAAQMQLRAAEVGDLSRRSRDDPECLWSERCRTRSKQALRETACWPAGCWSAACALCSFSTAPTRWAKASATGTGTACSRPNTKFTARSSISRARPC